MILAGIHSVQVHLAPGFRRGDGIRWQAYFVNDIDPGLPLERGGITQTHLTGLELVFDQVSK